MRNANEPKAILVYQLRADGKKKNMYIINSLSL